MPATKQFTTDVLVIGGGIAGLCAANKALDQGATVLIADKSATPWSGQVILSGGAFNCVSPEGVDAQVKFIVKEGEYLSDQEWTETYTRATYPCVQEMFKWGVPFQTDIQGKLVVSRGGFARVSRVEMTAPTLLGRALAKGATVLNKVYMADLLTQNNRVIGAVGFHYHTGDFHVIHAKATILACGGCNYKARRLWHMNCGEGVAMAYHAGAELRNAEFANQYMIANKYTLNNTRAASHIISSYENVLGEPLVNRYPELNPLSDPETPTWFAGLIFKRWISAFYKEIAAGRGPIYCNLTIKPEAAVGWGDTVRPKDRSMGYVTMMKRTGIDLAKEKVEWNPVPEYHAGPIRVDLNCQTTLPGLYATGDATQNGSAFQGAIEGCGLTGGVPLGFAMVTGFRAGTAAGKAATTTPEPTVNPTDIEQKQQALFAPLTITEGYDPYDAIREIQEIVFPLKNTFIKHQDRLKAALTGIAQVQTKLPTLMAKDSHELVRCHEAKSMALNAEFLYRASLMRTETRGTNIREDYPNRDDTNWLKWILIQKQADGTMRLWTEPVPIEKYPYKPR